ncbi:neutral cholesterol ester hydrolase 1-like [Nerophis ophidion]|uniref:neutral cholesterol ester hydrolase 1-like n=1 Tax=Nerophis ophidion TaxID=159077 RepID=UPI002ADEFF29|nr:neutral cholesterol ester hydrolase 1-like [Nerophis ophidion]
MFLLQLLVFMPVVLFLVLLLVLFLVLYLVLVQHKSWTPVPAGIKQPGKLRMLQLSYFVVVTGAFLLERVGVGHHITLMRWYFNNVERLMKNLTPTQDGKVLRVSDVTFDGVPVRVYEPRGGEERGLKRGLLYLHGGGWTYGSAKEGSCDAHNRTTADQLHAVVVSVEYGLYPEVQFPRQYLDCLAAAKHFLSPEVLAKYGVDPCRVGVSGDSAGGNLAAAVAQEISGDDNTSVKFSAQALIYPALQAVDFNTPSYRRNQDVLMLSRSLMVDFWLQYLGQDRSFKDHFLSNRHQAAVSPQLRARADWTALLPPRYKEGHQFFPPRDRTPSEGLGVPGLQDVRAAPLLASSEVLARCPRAYVVTCEYDVLRDDGLMYAQRLKDAGVAVTADHYEDGFHGCFSLTLVPFRFDLGVKTFRRYVRWLHDNL